jgi:nitroimidazol reductase NimA-like FMN-containing flavoprotein (pyridoxamine 5'-phosphate oxidase superfamily)
MTLSEHQTRVNNELTNVGVTGYGHGKMSVRYLPNIIREDEHVKGAVYGRSARGLAMLVATDKRIIYLERKPFFTATDEITYDVVSGVQTSHSLKTAIVLHTRLGNYELTYVNANCASIFVKYIEARVEHMGSPENNTTDFKSDSLRLIKISDSAVLFLKEHEYAVLSTADRTGNIRGAVVNYIFKDNYLYILTKDQTTKAHNMIANQQVAMTIYDSDQLKTAQLEGTANIEADLEKKILIFNEINKPHNYGGNFSLPPVSKLAAGAFIVFKITPTNIKYRSFKD